jgi:glucan 1,3-beta-glucosidase
VVTNTPIFVHTSQASNGQLGGSLVLNNFNLNNISVAVGVADGAVILPSGTTTIESWGQGNVYTGTSGTAKFTQGNIQAANKPEILLDGRTRPQYAGYAANQFVSVKSNGANGDGVTDDTAALKAVFDHVFQYPAFLLRWVLNPNNCGSILAV